MVLVVLVITIIGEEGLNCHGRMDDASVDWC